MKEQDIQAYKQAMQAYLKLSNVDRGILKALQDIVDDDAPPAAVTRGIAKQEMLHRCSANGLPAWLDGLLGSKER